MSEKKTIQINPDLFKVSEKNTSRKNQTLPKIKLKSTEKKTRDKTLRRNVLKMIREKQQEEYKRLFDKSEPKRSSSVNNSEKEFNKDFDESLEFFSSLASKHENQSHNTNTTFKKYPEMDSVLLQPHTPIFIDTNENVNVELPDVFSTPNTEIVQMKRPSIQLPPPPKYGCLKNGSLPTYKTMFRQTQRTYPPIQNTSSYPGPVPTSISSQNQNQIPLSFVQTEQQNDKIDTASDIRTNPYNIVQKHEKAQTIFNNKNQNRIKYLKRKKIFKRTYRVGRSSTKPQIGVLVSNRTVRNRITTESQLLKQTPIQDVRKFLIKKGFIKVGSNTPNDVLRKMYESVSLVCGEIQNHNPENLLYNFIHDTAHS